MREGNNMTFPKIRKNEDLINKPNLGFFRSLFALGKNAYFQNLHLGPEKSSFCPTHF